MGKMRRFRPFANDRSRPIVLKTRSLGWWWQYLNRGGLLGSSLLRQ
jgi:hypothetical protein